MAQAREADRLRSPFIIQDSNSVKADKTGLSEGELITHYSSDAVTLKVIRDDLQILVDKKITPRAPGTTIAITHFKNWGDTQISLLMHAKPTLSGQVAALVQAVVEYNKTRIPEEMVKIGMGGSYHTWSPTYPDQMGLLINTCNLKLDMQDTTDGFRRINLNLNDDPATVTISPGVTTGELMAFFLKYDVCFDSDVILSTVTYGGVLSGGCHGVGKDQQSMSDWIVSLRVVDGGGEIRNLPNDPEAKSVTPEEVLKAAQVNLGLFGVVLEFTVKVQPMSKSDVKNIFSKKLEDIVPPLSCCDEIFDREHTKKMAELLQQYWSVEIFWFPFNSIVDRILSILPLVKGSGDNPNKIPEVSELRLSAESVFASGLGDFWQRLIEAIKTKSLLPLLWSAWDDHLWVRGIDKSDKQITREPGIPFWSRVIDIAQQAGGQYILAPMMKNFPNSVPLSLMTGYQLVKMQYGTFQQEEVVRTPWAIHYRDGLDIMKVYDMEFAFPINITNPLLVVKAVRKLIEIVEDYAFNGKFPKSDDVQEFAFEEDEGSKIHFPLSLCMEMRVMHKSEAFMCPASIGNEDHIAYIEVLSSAGTQGYEQFFTDVATAWLGLGGIPHWQKQWEFLTKEKPELYSQLRDKYGGNMTSFKKVYNELKLDPNGIFRNKTMGLLLDMPSMGN